jgi:hypothetical protein
MEVAEKIQIVCQMPRVDISVPEIFGDNGLEEILVMPDVRMPVL